MVKAYQLTADQHEEAAEPLQGPTASRSAPASSHKKRRIARELDAPFFKIASMDIVNLPLLSYVAGKHVRWSSPQVWRRWGIRGGRGDGSRRRVTRISFCCIVCRSTLRTASYPSAKHGDPTEAFDVPVGFSDHTLGTSIPLAAVALGACVIEKHFTLDKDMAGWDHAISADPAELRTIVEEGMTRFCRTWQLQSRTVTDAEYKKRRQFRRSLVARSPLSRGHVIREGTSTQNVPAPASRRTNFAI